MITKEYCPQTLLKFMHKVFNTVDILQRGGKKREERERETEEERRREGEEEGER